MLLFLRLIKEKILDTEAEYLYFCLNALSKCSWGAFVHKDEKMAEGLTKENKQWNNFNFSYSLKGITNGHAGKKLLNSNITYGVVVQLEAYRIP